MSKMTDENVISNGFLCKLFGFRRLKQWIGRPKYEFDQKTGDNAKQAIVVVAAF